MAFYHGTSSVANIKGKLIPPCKHNFGINEVGRVKHENKVFFTTFKDYAYSYAKSTCKRVGGVPVVYEVLSTHPKLMVETKECDVYYDSQCLILEEV